MNSITKTIAAAITAAGLLGATGVFAQDQSAQPEPEASPNSQQMQGMMEGMQGGNMQGMMGMMSQMSEMMENCNNMMQAMNNNMGQEKPETDGAKPDNG
ncbi:MULTISPECIES: hypothetical protein [Aurantimonadaceae]|uniref:Pentapeptide MXKDX repeat protein n=1 Tax=Jiella pelagia TaxID=2986949 RepID=A0ABY7C5R6_9HYPH|nr:MULTISPECIES: hypothetical protein [Aurantimonadaceae]ORE97011.1 hypothetical protein ATO4_10939 [Aurantimonas sp. 22II-16-19i]WAP71416.1 hypothetical protein OH818_28435 [Jiella pelagia]